MPKVLNAKDVGFAGHIGAVYVGRPTQWGNPFRIGKDGNREQVIDRYRLWISTQPRLLKQLEVLRGKDLVCWCAPEKCHADVLLALANNQPTPGPKER